MEQAFWKIRNVKRRTRTKYRVYAIEHDMTIAQVLEMLEKYL